MGGAGFAAEPVLVVNEPVGWLGRKVLGLTLKRSITRSDPTILDGQGRPIATLRNDDRAIDKVSHLGNPAYGDFAAGNGDLQVIGLSGRLEMTLHFRGQWLWVTDPAGRTVGSVANRSQPGDDGVALSFYGPNPNTVGPGPLASYVFTAPGDEVGTLAGPFLTGPSPVDHEVQDLAGRTVAHVSSAGRSIRLVVGEPVAEPLRTLLAAFGCSLVKRGWLRIPLPIDG